MEYAFSHCGLPQPLFGHYLNDPAVMKAWGHSAFNEALRCLAHGQENFICSIHDLLSQAVAPEETRYNEIEKNRH